MFGGPRQRQRKQDISGVLCLASIAHRNAKPRRYYIADFIYRPLTGEFGQQAIVEPVTEEYGQAQIVGLVSKLFDRNHGDRMGRSIEKVGYNFQGLSRGFGTLRPQRLSLVEKIDERP